MAAVRIFGAVVGVLLNVATATTVIRVLITPRGRPSQLTHFVDRALDNAFSVVTRRLEYEQRDRVLAVFGPIELLSLLFVWVVAFLFGYALMVWPATHDFAGALRESVSSIFTLGFAATHGGWATFVDGLEAATGLVLVAAQIAYLPTLYGAFNRRETEVTLLAARSGEPSWGPEMLARSRYGVIADLGGLYEQWERWAADVAESHSNYPVLLRFRSPTPLASWLVSLICVMDSAALYSALSPSEMPMEARLCLRMGFTCLRQIGRAIGLPVNDDPDPDGDIVLTYDEFVAGVKRVAAEGFPIERTPEEAWPQFRGWRVNYETLAYRLAYRIDAVPALWTGPRRRGDAPIAPRRPANRAPGGAKAWGASLASAGTQTAAGTQTTDAGTAETVVLPGGIPGPDE